MPKFDVFISRFAEADLNEIVSYFYDENEKYASDLYTKLKSKIESLTEFPGKGKIVPELERQNILKYRQLIEGNYRIIYSIVEKKVYIHIVIDSRRDLEDILLHKLTEISELD